MDNLLFLKTGLKKKIYDHKCDRIIEHKVERPSNKFEDKFINKIKIYDINQKSESEVELLSIIKELFYFDNKTPIIDFFNSLYCDGMQTSNSSIEYIDVNQEIEKESDIKIQIENEYKKIQYKIEFRIEDYENLGIIISRDELYNKSNKIISLFGESQVLKKKNNKLELNKINPYIIMLNSNMEVPDVLEFKSNNDNNYSYKFNILKSWKYDLKKMFDENMYLFFPLKIFDLKKRLFNMGDDPICDELIRYEIVRFFREMNIYLKKVKEKDAISQSDIDKFNSIASTLLLNVISKDNQLLSQVDKKFVDSLMITVS